MVKQDVVATNHREDAFKFFGFDRTLFDQVLLGPGDCSWRLAGVGFAFQLG